MAVLGTWAWRRSTPSTPLRPRLPQPLYHVMLLVLCTPCHLPRWAWCRSTPSKPNRCQQAAYLQATDIVWKVLLCLMLFCLANFLKVRAFGCMGLRVQRDTWRTGGGRSISSTSTATPRRLMKAAIPGSSMG